MNAHVLGLAGDGPLDSLLAFHRRVERQLAELATLHARLEADGASAATSASAAAILGCLGGACARHHAEEEHELFPLLERRIDDVAERKRFRLLCTQLQGEHRLIEAAWRRLRRPLEAVAEGFERRLDVDAIQSFRALCAVHIGAEEASLHRIAMRRLDPGDLHRLRQRLAARRARQVAA